jgi:hypothetical protein
MSRRRFQVHRSSRQWAGRGALAAAAATVGYFAVMNSLAQVVAHTDPVIAHYLAPRDGRITANLAVSLLGVDVTLADRHHADVLAREALLREPFAVPAVSILGVNAELRGDRRQARQLFDYSQKLSRRDLQTQLWAIEDAVSRKDIAGALHHYDIALRTNTKSWELLFSVMNAATTDSTIRAGLVQTLSQKPIWAESFLAYAGSHTPDPEATAALFTKLDRTGVTITDGARASVINALIERGELEQAWRFYATNISGALRQSSRDPNFTTKTDVPSMLDWVPIDDGTVSGTIQRGDAGGMFDFAAPSSVGGPLLRQVQLLPPGVYHVTGVSSGIEQSSSALPYWSLSCRNQGKELGRVLVPNSNQQNGRFSGRLVVPKGCPVQELTLIARPSDGVSGVTGQIRHIQLSPVPISVSINRFRSERLNRSSVQPRS